MRYFRYKGPKTTEDPVLREEYKKFIENEKKLMRRCDRAEGIGCGLVLLVTGACLSFSIWGLTQIPQPEGNAFLIIAYILGIVDKSTSVESLFSIISLGIAAFINTPKYILFISILNAKTIITIFVKIFFIFTSPLIFNI